MLEQQVRLDGLPVERVLAGWADLVRRVVGRPAVTPPGGAT